MTRRRLLFASVLAAALLAGGLVATLLMTTGNGGGSAAAPVTGAARVAALLDGIPQQGVVLGSAAAPVTLVEFADPQCPFCGDWERVALPVLVERYVRPGKVRIVFNGMTFVGGDSLVAMRTALAASLQGRFWNVLELLYENQGQENTGWVTEPLLRSIGDAVPGLDAQEMLAARTSPAVDRALAEADALAREAGVNATPTFAVGKTGGTLRIVPVSSLEASALTPSIDDALAQ